MKQFVFAVKNAWRGIFSKKLLSGIVISAMAVGLIFPIIIFSQINFFSENYGFPYYNDIERTVVAEFNCPVTDEASIKRCAEAWGSVNSVGFFATHTATLEYGGKSYLGNVAGYNGEYTEIGKTVLLDGRFLTEEELETGAKVCLALSGAGRSYGKSLRVGSRITVAGTEFEIVGTVRDNKVYGGLMIPYKAMCDWLDGSTLQFRAYLQTRGEPDIKEINSAMLKSENIDKIDLRTAVCVQEELFSRVADIFKQKLLLGAVAAVFSMLSFTLIIAGKALNEQYVLGVKTLMGATKSQLFLELLLQNFILIEIASVIAMTVSAVVIRAASGFEALFDGSVITAAEALCVLMTFFTTSAAFIPLLKGSVCDLLKNSND